MTYLTWIPRLLWLALWFAGQLLITNITVIRDNLSPGQHSTPGIAEFPTRCRSEFEATLLAAMISLTPGTLTLGARVAPSDAGEGQRFLYVHGMYHDGADSLRASLADMERHMLAGIRVKGGTS